MRLAWLFSLQGAKNKDCNIALNHDLLINPLQLSTAAKATELRQTILCYLYMYMYMYMHVLLNCIHVHVACIIILHHVISSNLPQYARASNLGKNTHVEGTTRNEVEHKLTHWRAIN